MILVYLTLNGVMLRSDCYTFDELSNGTETQIFIL